MSRHPGVADLPSRDGVGASCVAAPATGWSSVLAFLCDRFPMIAPREWEDRMTRGDVVDDCGMSLGPQAPFRPHAKIFYYRSLPKEVPIPFEAPVLFHDDLLVAVDKPHFLPVTPGGAYLQQTLLVRLKRSLGIESLTPMHRLDRDTAGVMLFSIQPATLGCSGLSTPAMPAPIMISMTIANPIGYSQTRHQVALWVRIFSASPCTRFCDRT